MTPRRGRPTVDLEADRRDDVARDVDAEIAFHLASRTERLIALGMSPEKARARAVERFGSIRDARTQLLSTAVTRTRHMRYIDRIHAVRQDVGYSVRQLRRSPGFSIAVIATLGLGIGANATMFGAIDQLLLRPPGQVADPARLMTVAMRNTHLDASQVQRVLSFPIYRDLRRANDVFTHVGITRAMNVDFGSGAGMKSVAALLGNADYFAALGVRPYMGRFFNSDEAGDASSAPSVVVGYDFWQRTLAGDRSIVGRTIPLSGAPPGFNGIGLTTVDVWLPLTDGMSLAAIASMAQQRQMYAYILYVRLAPGVTAVRAAEAAAAAVDGGARSAGETDAHLRAIGQRIELTSALPKDARGDAPESRIAELLGAVSLFVLLLACANVMNLQLARGIRRRREIAVRIALGVSRGRLVRQLALDCLLLSVAGGALGLVIARFGGQVVRETLLGRSLGSLAVVDMRVLAFSAAAVLATGLVTGLVPAGEMLRTDLVTALKEGARSGESSRTNRIQMLLQATQAMLTTVLLVGTGLFVLSLKRIEAVPLGFDPSHAAVVRLNFSGGRAMPASDETPDQHAQTLALFHRLEQTARETPGVAEAAIALTAPFEGGYARSVTIPGRDSTPVTREGGPYYNAVSAGYFAAIGSRIVAGRPFTTSDDAKAPSVAIINETAARMWWPNESAVGKCVRLDDAASPCIQIVGVMQNTHRRRIVEDDFVQLFLPIDQAQGVSPGVVIFRAGGSVDDVIPRAQLRLQSAAAGLPYVNVRPLEALVAPGMRAWTLGAAMFGVFGALALALAAIGLYSVLAYDVAQRQQELGVRRALGAAVVDIAALIVRRGLVAVSVGLLAGTAIAVAAGRTIAPLLFETSWHEPRVYAAVALVLGAVSLAATALPAWRASQVEPSIALRGQ